ncbi:hypothetical protein [Curtobacterium sp. MCPF17_052]|uniref:hypothetical protein n=1 Tax=Curtobacterium sp. MCPF17_052 TaxID=2175655 RepID=UPI0024DF439E|nr:hypothetical protein [Curtobacterium sp. MCPF17_052]WIB11665.1 hypothetical protein DEJ36_12080 [Curtobacterium sp. MCPF17_052]
MLLVAVAAALAVGVVALLVGTLGDGEHGAMLLAGRLASSASVLAVITAVWLADGMHHVPPTTSADAPPVRI